MRSWILAALAMGMGVSADVTRLPQSMNENFMMPRQTTACENTATSRSCWGDFSTDTNWYTETPDTGVTREYWLSLELIDCALDGYAREWCIAFNGTVPGPTIIVSTTYLELNLGADRPVLKSHMRCFRCYIRHGTLQGQPCSLADIS